MHFNTMEPIREYYQQGKPGEVDGIDSRTESFHAVAQQP